MGVGLSTEYLTGRPQSVCQDCVLSNGDGQPGAPENKGAKMAEVQSLDSSSE